MKIKRTIKKDAYGVLITLEDGKKVIGRAHVYVLKNALHKKPFALLEDLFVEEKYRSQGLGSKLTKLAIAEAKKRKCYKLIATSRNSKSWLKKYYAKFGLKVWGVEFRMDF